MWFCKRYRIERKRLIALIKAKEEYIKSLEEEVYKWKARALEVKEERKK